MPTLQLPRDDRWGSLGAGLGNVLGAAVDQAYKARVANQVGQIWRDPTIPDDQKLTESIRRYGDIGGQFGLGIMKAKTLSAQLADIHAQTSQRGAMAALDAAKAEEERLKLPLTSQTALARLQELQAKVVTEQGKPALQKAQTEAEAALVPQRQAQTQAALAEVPLRAAETGAAQALAPERQSAVTKNVAETAKLGLESEKLQEQLNRMRQVAEGGGSGLDVALAPYGLNSDQVAGAKQAALQADSVKPGTGIKAALDYAQKFSGATPTDIRKDARDAAEGATSVNRFLDSFERNPKTGLLTGATIKAWWEGKGGASGDADLLNQYDAGLLQASDLATKGGGFWSQGRFHLAQDVTATIRDSPLRAVINMDQVAERRIADLQNAKLSDPRAPMKDVDQSIAAWQDVKRRTSAYQTYTTPDQKTIVTHLGDQLDAGSFKVLVRAGGEYKRKDTNQTFTGADIVAQAQARGISPQQVMQAANIDPTPVGAAARVQ